MQISAAWNSREGAPLGRNQYLELEIKKPKPNGASTKLSQFFSLSWSPKREMSIPYLWMGR